MRLYFLKLVCAALSAVAASAHADATTVLTSTHPGFIQTAGLSGDLTVSFSYSTDPITSGDPFSGIIGWGVDTRIMLMDSLGNQLPGGGIMAASELFYLNQTFQNPPVIADLGPVTFHIASAVEQILIFSTLQLYNASPPHILLQFTDGLLILPAAGDFTVVPTPLPTTIALFGAGLGLLVAISRRRTEIKAPAPN